MNTRVKEFRIAQKMLAYRMAKVFGVSVETLCCLAENIAEEDRRYEDLQ